MVTLLVASLICFLFFYCVLTPCRQTSHYDIGRDKFNILMKNQFNTSVNMEVTCANPIRWCYHINYFFLDLT